MSAGPAAVSSTHKTRDGIGPLQSRKSTVNTHGGGALESNRFGSDADGPRMLLTPTYHVFRMYVLFQDATSLPVRVDAGSFTDEALKLPRLDALAAQGGDGSIWLATVNLDPDHEVRISATVDGSPGRAAHGEVLTAPRVDSVNTFTQSADVVPQPRSGQVVQGALILTPAAKSVAVIKIQ
jgi:alpha-N-arabinofuranosidase